MFSSIPKILLYSRMFLAFVIASLALFEFDLASIIVVVLMYFGILSDILDGIVARKLNVSTDDLRKHDTVIDLFFYCSIVFFILSTNPEILTGNWEVVTLILALEALMYALSLARFSQLPSPHAILSKCWGIYMIIEFTLVMAGVKGNHFRIALFFGLVAHIDRVLIYGLLRKWDHDIPSAYHAYLIRQGKTIKRWKILNG